MASKTRMIATIYAWRVLAYGFIMPVTLAVSLFSARQMNRRYEGREIEKRLSDDPIYRDTLTQWRRWEKVLSNNSESLTALNQAAARRNRRVREAWNQSVINNLQESRQLSRNARERLAEIRSQHESAVNSDRFLLKFVLVGLAVMAPLGAAVSAYSRHRRWRTLFIVVCQSSDMTFNFLAGSMILSALPPVACYGIASMLALAFVFAGMTAYEQASVPINTRRRLWVEGERLRLQAIFELHQAPPKPDKSSTSKPEDLPKEPGLIVNVFIDNELYRKNFTQRDIAKHAGVSPAYISRLIRRHPKHRNYEKWRRNLPKRVKQSVN